MSALEHESGVGRGAGTAMPFVVCAPSEILDALLRVIGEDAAMAWERQAVQLIQWDDTRESLLRGTALHGRRIRVQRGDLGLRHTTIKGGVLGGGCYLALYAHERWYMRVVIDIHGLDRLLASVRADDA